MKSSEKATEHMEVHSNQSPADDAGGEGSLGEAEEDDDFDDAGSIIYKPEESDEEDEGQEAREND